MAGRNPDEDVLEMLQKYPLMNEYWEDKRGKAHLIQVPAYVLASMSSSLHTVGSCRGFEDIPHDQKWYKLPGCKASTRTGIATDLCCLSQVSDAFNSRVV